MPFIREAIVVTLDHRDRPHVAPLGLIERGDLVVIAPFRPSTTLANLEHRPYASACYTDEVRVFAGCVTGRRRDWPVVPTERIPGFRLAACLAHDELEVVAVEPDALRPRFLCRVVHAAQHAPFKGLNRARFAVIEAAILLSRRRLLPSAEIEEGFARLRPLVDKTAGEAEREAWDWLEKARAESPDEPR
ncbi:MAG: DUF447 family protein [Geminicoccaceae bacterium]|nr:DUF447 family protein [Geminicoccaceae bacterium]